MSEATPLTFSEEGQQRFLQQAFSLWVTPEIEHRCDRGLLPSNFEFVAAQIVFWPEHYGPRRLEMREMLAAELCRKIEDVADCRGTKRIN